jgi:tRNA guanosine-2'-O-methyltransferase
LCSSCGHACLPARPQIFGGKKLVIANKKLVEQPGFREQSATAESWVDVEEVAVPALDSWLKTKRLEGYEIVGLEQTNESQDLLHMRAFDPKTYSAEVHAVASFSLCVMLS